MIDITTRTGNFRGGFTLLELVIVISVIAALAAMGFPAWRMIKHRVDVSSTDTLVNSIATAITTYSTKTWTWNTGTPAAPIMRTYHMFDLNHLGFNGTTSPADNKPDLENVPKSGNLKFFSIDGYTPPEKDFYNTGTKSYPTTNVPPGDTYDGNFPMAVLNSGYTGFVNMASPSVKKSFINKRGQIVDAWQRPLRIAFAAKIFGTQSFGVWSAGYDGKDGILSTTFQDDTTQPNSDDLRSWESSSGK